MERNIDLIVKLESENYELIEDNKHYLFTKDDPDDYLFVTKLILNTRVNCYIEKSSQITFVSLKTVSEMLNTTNNYINQIAKELNVSRSAYLPIIKNRLIRFFNIEIIKLEDIHLFFEQIKKRPSFDKKKPSLYLKYINTKSRISSNLRAKYNNGIS